VGRSSNGRKPSFVMGLRNEHLLQQLLTQDHTKSLDQLFQVATTFEAAENEALKCVECESQTSVAPVTGKNPKSVPRSSPRSVSSSLVQFSSLPKNSFIPIVPVVGIIMLRNHVDFTVLSVISVERLAALPKSAILQL